MAAEEGVHNLFLQKDFFSVALQDIKHLNQSVVHVTTSLSKCHQFKCEIKTINKQVQLHYQNPGS